MQIILLFFGFFLLSPVLCTHFRGATFSWEPLNNGSLEVSFRVSWVTLFAFCDQTTIANGTLLSGRGNNMTCLTGCKGIVGSFDFFCTDYSLEDQWSSGRNSIIFTMPGNVTKVAIGYTGGNWIRTVGNGRWSLQMTIDTTVRRDTGRINHSPTVDLPPLLKVQSNCSYTIKLPVFDVDGDSVRCRWARGKSECESVCNKFPNATLNETSCIIEYTPHWITSMHVMTIQIEDFATKNSLVPLSSIPLQVMVSIQNIGRCDQVPEFVGPTPYDDACFPVEVGKAFVVTLKARSHTKLKSITTSSPVGMVRSASVFTNVLTWHYITVNVTWTPSVKDAGRDRSLCFYATDELSVSSPLRCTKLPVPGLQKRRTDCGTKVDCRAPPNLLHGNMTYNVTTLGSLTTYTCNEGYDMNGNNTAVCLQNGTWSRLRAVCTIIDCGPPPTLAHGKVQATGTTYLSVSTFTCDTGYESTGSRLPIICSAKHTWSGTAPSCKIKDCGPPMKPDHSKLVSTGTHYLSVSTYRCEPGYDLSGANTQTICLANGTWSGTPPICNIKDCGKPPPPDNGSVHFNTTAYQSRSVFQCNTKFTMVGHANATCLASGMWSQPAPVCVTTVYDCGQPTSPVHGNVTYTSTTSSSVCLYVCDHGYTLVGSHNATCLQSRKWSDPAPTCVLPDCGFPPLIGNGTVQAPNTTYGSVATYQCIVGFNMIARNNTLTCLDTGQWSIGPPTCMIIDCGIPDAPVNGSVDFTFTTFKSICTYSCSEGFKLIGTSISKCMASGKWNDVMPYCTEKACSLLDHPEGGEVTYSSTRHGSLASYSCHVGQVLVGTSKRKCKAGVWTGDVPICQGDSYTNKDDYLAGQSVMMMCIVACFLVALLLLLLIIIIVAGMLRQPHPGLDKGTSTAGQWSKCWDEPYNNNISNDTSDTNYCPTSTNTLTRNIHSSRTLVPITDTHYKQKMGNPIFSITEVP